VLAESTDQPHVIDALRFVFADGGFAGRLLDWAHQFLATTLQIVRKPADQRGFAVIPRDGQSSAAPTRPPTACG
jgi:hypothetical protein